MTEDSSQIVIKVSGKVEIERLIAILNLGVCSALDNNVLSIEEAAAYLYSPYTMEQMKKLGLAQELIDTIHLGTELEDVESLLPDKLKDSIEEIEAETLKFMQALLTTAPNTSPPPKWIQSQVVSK